MLRCGGRGACWSSTSVLVRCWEQNLNAHKYWSEQTWKSMRALLTNCSGDRRSQHLNAQQGEEQARGSAMPSYAGNAWPSTQSWSMPPRTACAMQTNTKIQGNRQRKWNVHLIHYSLARSHKAVSSCQQNIKTNRTLFLYLRSEGKESCLKSF